MRPTPTTSIQPSTPTFYEFKSLNTERGRSCLDRISSLPDELLAQVLSFLPTRCAVSTSVLSSRWRHLFTLTSSLSFDDTPCFDGGPFEALEKRRFAKFVTKILELHQIVPIKEFRLVCHGDYHKSDINGWHSFAVQKGVQDLHYEVKEHKFHGPPNDIFMCETLVRLKIIGLGMYPYFLEIPLSACFPKLKILHLDNLHINDDDLVENLFTGCELLEEMTLKKCYSHTRRHLMMSTRLLQILRIESCNFDYGLFEIDAPNLVHLTHKFNSGVKLAPSWKDSSSFLKAELYFKFDAIWYDFELLKASARKVTELYLGSFSQKFHLALDESEVTLEFPRLRKLSLSSFHAWENVISLLDKSPRLETLIFKSGPGSWVPARPKEALRSFSCQAKVIEVHSFSDSDQALLHLGHLLENAGALKKLILHKKYSVYMEEEEIEEEEEEEEEEELRLRKVLSTLPKASKDCCIEVLN